MVRQQEVKVEASTISIEIIGETMIDRIDFLTFAATTLNPHLTVEEAVRTAHEIMRQIDEAKAALEREKAEKEAHWAKVLDVVRELAVQFDEVKNIEPVVRLIQLLEKENCNEEKTSAAAEAFGAIRFHNAAKMIWRRNSPNATPRNRETADIFAGCLNFRFRWPNESLAWHRQEFLFRMADIDPTISVK